MNDPGSSLHRLTLFAAVILLALALAGCAKKITSVDPSYISPEGQPETSALQVVYSSLPIDMNLYQKPGSDCDQCPDELLWTQPIYPAGDGVINGMIFDGTAASTYQILRRESNGSYAPLYDYALNPSQRFAKSGWKLFLWQDLRPSGFDPPTYLGRGIVSGVVTPTTPLTNVASIRAGDLVEIELQDIDSLRVIGYTPVANATGYILQIYQPIESDTAAALHNAVPAPFASKDNRDYYAAWLPATGGVIDADRTKVLSQLAFGSQAEYKVHMAAVDSQGRLIGFSYGDLAEAKAPEGYRLKYLGGSIIVVSPSIRPGTIPPPFPIRLTEIAPSPRSVAALAGQVRQVKTLFGGR
jgi:hypothetical protein